MFGSTDSDEGTALLPSRRRNDNSSHAPARSLTLDRIVLVALLGGMVGLSILYQHRLNDLANELQSERHRIEILDHVLEEHDSVIERFNASVTNTDVLSRLDSLERNFSHTQRHVENELKQVQHDITIQLRDTVEDLNESVAAAKLDITKEVNKVKEDVEQYTVHTEAQFSMENSFMVYQIAGTFTLLSCLISSWHMTAHLRRMNEPDVQRRILAILWMAPIYAITSWFSLVFVESAEGYLAIIKDAYEAYVIYQFLAFCIAVLGKGDRNVVVDLLARRADHLTPPFRLFGCFEICGCCKAEPFENNRALADAILLQCQMFALQFVFFRPLITTALVLMDKFHYYGAGTGSSDYRSPQFYLIIFQNISIFVAFTGLLKFYHAVEEDLAWLNPFHKFLCVKGVVFLTFWQGLAISILAETTDVGTGRNGDGSQEQWAQSAQNFLICLEMLLFSIAHFHCFPTEEWTEGYRVKKNKGAFGDSLALGDFLKDVKLVLRKNTGGKSKKKPSQPAIPEGNEDDSESVDDTVTSASACSNYNNDAADDAECTIVDILKDTLSVSSDDPDVDFEEAKRRLLESEVLKNIDVEQNKEHDEEDHNSVSSHDDDDEELEGVNNQTKGEKSLEAAPMSPDDDLNDNIIGNGKGDLAPENNHFEADDEATDQQQSKSEGDDNVSQREVQLKDDEADETGEPSKDIEIENTGEQSKDVEKENDGESDETKKADKTSNQWEDTSDEHVALLTDLLRPSIFTTTASLAESEKQAQKRTLSKK